MDCITGPMPNPSEIYNYIMYHIHWLYKQTQHADFHANEQVKASFYTIPNKCTVLYALCTSAGSQCHLNSIIPFEFLMLSTVSEIITLNSAFKSSDWLLWLCWGKLKCDVQYTICCNGNVLGPFLWIFNVFNIRFQTKSRSTQTVPYTLNI